MRSYPNDLQPKLAAVSGLTTQKCKAAGMPPSKRTQGCDKRRLRRLVATFALLTPRQPATTLTKNFFPTVVRAGRNEGVSRGTDGFLFTAVIQSFVGAWRRYFCESKASARAGPARIYKYVTCRVGGTPLRKQRRPCKNSPARCILRRLFLFHSSHSKVLWAPGADIFAGARRLRTQAWSVYKIRDMPSGRHTVTQTTPPL